jgi:hypothetical protein
MAAGDGLVIMTPTSIAHAGTSASINSDGGVDFTAVTSLSLNGVFTSSFDNYLIVANYKTSTATSIYARLRAAGTDDTGSNYARQYLYVTSTSVTGQRVTSQTEGLGFGYGATSDSGEHFHIYGPFLAQPTASRSVNVYGGTVELNDWASTHSLSTSYDGLTLRTSTVNTFTGNVVVFGYEE